MDISSFHLVPPDILALGARVMFGITLIHFGLPKIKDLRGNGAWFSSIQFKPGFFWGTLVALVEVVGGIFIIFGLLTDVWVALAMFILITGTVWKIKLKKEFSDWTYDVVLFFVGAYVIVFGPGVLALTHNSPFPWMSVEVALVSITAAVVLNYMPELFGARFKNWKA